MLERELFRAAIAVVGVAGGRGPPGAEQLGIVIAQRRRRAIHVGLAADAELRAGAEQVQLLELEARGALAALAAEGDAGIQRPHILRHHFDVDHAVVPRHGPDVRILQIARAAQDARGFFEQPASYASPEWNSS